MNKEKLDFYKSVAAGLLQAPKCSPSMTVNHRVCATSKHLTWTARQTLKSDRWLYLVRTFFCEIKLHIDKHTNSFCMKLSRVSKWLQTLRTSTAWCDCPDGWSVKVQIAICTSLLGTSVWIVTGQCCCHARRNSINDWIFQSFLRTKWRYLFLLYLIMGCLSLGENTLYVWFMDWWQLGFIHPGLGVWSCSFLAKISYLRTFPHGNILKFDKCVHIWYETLLVVTFLPAAQYRLVRTRSYLEEPSSGTLSGCTVWWSTLGMTQNSCR